MATTTIRVTGMTCQHCVNAVTSELQELADVDNVNVDLVPGGVSNVTIMSKRELSPEEIAAAVSEAGYELTS